MQIKSLAAENFRLLASKEKNKIMLDKDYTLIVGRNNSGKTSFIELVEKFLSDSNNFKFADFSISSYKYFTKAYQIYEQFKELKEKNKEEDAEEINTLKGKMTETIPSIKLEVVITYNGEKDDISHLEPFITELKTESNTIIIEYEYFCKDPEKFFDKYDKFKEEINFIEYTEKYYSNNYSCRIWTIDPTNRQNRYLIDNKKTGKTDLNRLLSASFIYARRELDDKADDRTRNLSHLFDEYFKLIDNKDEELLLELERMMAETSVSWDDEYENIFKEYYLALNNFGYPGLNEKDITLKSQFSPKKILKNNTKVFYNSSEDYKLPEAYNGLGFSNLIYMVLKLLYFYKEFKEKGTRLQMIFIEEPEVHLHPQMQKTFIRNILNFIKENIKTEGDPLNWNVQIIITSHSSYIISEGNYNNIRYLKNRGDFVETKDLKTFVEEKPDGAEFLEKYLELEKCDMFFADKVILIEGTVERMLLPLMIKKISSSKKENNLISEYISVIEVGGAYAYKFESLLKFIEVKTLVITDLDSIDPVNERSSVPPVTGKGYETSNKTLIKWLPGEKMIDELLEFNEEDKLACNDMFRIAYQHPVKSERCKDKICGRSFEEQFIIENIDLIYEKHDKFESFSTPSGKVKKKVKDNFPGNIDNLVIDEDKVDTIASVIANKPTFAYDIMLYLELDNWSIPIYIREGLEWLQE